MTVPARVAQEAPAPSEAGSLARRLAQARQQIVEQYCRDSKLQPQEALEKVEAIDPASHVEHVLDRPPHMTSWWDLDQLAAAAPELAEERWLEIRAEALAELQSGHRAAECVESAESGSWERAQFLAIRDDLTKEWRPRSGIERTLIDMMAQAWAQQMHWTSRLTTLDAVTSSEVGNGKVGPPQVSFAQAIEQAAAMTDRFSRIFMRALRQLRDLRRYSPTVILQAGQVNIGGQQMNVSGTQAERPDKIPGDSHVGKLDTVHDLSAESPAVVDGGS